jgi:hypothetical protein
MSAPKVVNFTIYGERSSGTVFLEEAITKNFNLPVIWYYDWKHFFGMYDFDTDNANVTEEGNAIDNTIFIGIVRDPVAWLNSFSKNLQYVPACNRELTHFLNNPFYSAVGEGEQEEVIQEDVNYITKERFKNIFELRKLKNDFLMNVVRTKVKNYVLIRYEDLLNNYDNTLDQIKNAYNLVKTHEEYEKIVNHTNGSGLFTGERAIDFSCDTINDIWSMLDVAQEKELGYCNILIKAAELEPPVLEPPALEPVIQEALEPPALEPPVLEPPVLEPPVLEPPVKEAIKKNVRTIPSMRLEGVIRPKTAPIVKRNYLPVARFVNNQITNEEKKEKEEVITNVTNIIPRIAPMFRTIIVSKQIEKEATVKQVKYKKGAFFDMKR